MRLKKTKKTKKRLKDGNLSQDSYMAEKNQTNQTKPKTRTTKQP